MMVVPDTLADARFQLNQFVSAQPTLQSVEHALLGAQPALLSVLTMCG